MQSTLNPLQSANQLGQSLWLDFIQRSLMESGDLDRLINDDAVTGMTSNPAIFEAAIANTDEYDQQLRELLATQPDAEPMDLFKQLAITDIQNAADRFHTTWKNSRGDDGMVSLEVSPALAHDSAATVREALELRDAVARDNVMIKVPGTMAGVRAFEELTRRGVSVNVTLLFSLSRYRQIADAFVSGLQQRLDDGESIGQVASVASFFVSRVDSAVDKALAEHGDETSPLAGQIAIANAKAAFAYYQQLFDGPQFALLRTAGAMPQRLLWASTGTKNPDYSDVYYVEELMGPETVNTLPPKTMEAFRDHGVVEPRLLNGIDHAQRQLQQLAELNIDLDSITDQLEADGITSFADAFDRLLKALAAKSTTLRSL